MKTGNKKKTEIMKMENMTEEEIDKYIDERAKDGTPKELLVLCLIQEIKREYEEVKALYDDMFSR
jgi:hypothetical protein